MSDQVGTAVLELTTNSATLVSDLAKVKAELKGVADTAAASGAAASADWATMGQAIAAVSRQLAEQRVRSEELRSHTSALGNAFSELKGTLGELAGAFGVAFSIDRAVEFLKGVAEEADALQNLSLQTQISIHDLQVLGAASRDYGTNTEELARALFQLKQRIAGGDDSVATAYHVMGLRLEDIKNLDPVNLFLETERGLGRLHGSIRDTAAADLFGGRLGSSMLALSTGVDEAIKKAKDLNKVTSDESVKAAAEYANAVKRAQDNLHSWVMEIEGSALIGLNTLSDAVDRGASKWDLFKAMFVDFTNSGLRVGASTSALATLLDHLNQKTDENTEAVDRNLAAARRLMAGHREVITALDAEGEAAVFMATLSEDALKPLTAWQTTYLAQLKELGQLTAKNAAAISVNAAQYDAYVAALERAKEAQRKAEEAAKKALEQEKAAILETTRLWDEYTELVITQSGTAMDAQIAAIDRWAADLTAKVQKAGADTAAFYDALFAVVQQKQLGVLVNWSAIAAESSESWKRNLEQTAEKAAATYQYMLEHAELFRAGTIEKFRDVAEQARQAADTWFGSWNAHLDELDQHAKSTAGGMASSFQAAADQIHAAFEFIGSALPTPESLRALALEPGSMLGLGIPGVGPSDVSLSGLTRRPKVRDSGGPVSAGMPYLIGRGAQPELFVPESNGTMVPNAGGVHLTVNVNGSVLGDPAKIARAVRDAIDGGLRTAGARIGAA